VHGVSHWTLLYRRAYVIGHCYIGWCVLCSTTRLDYCNSWLYGTSNRNLDKLQRIQNFLARTVANACWSESDSATVVTCCLHWLPIRQRTQLKIGLLGFKATHSLLPPYQPYILSYHHPTRQLRSSSVHQFFKSAVNVNFLLAYGST